MAVIVELTIDAVDFDLGKVTQAPGDIHLELERVVPIGGEVMPFFWATGEDFESFEAHVREEELVETLTAVARVEDRVLYHVEWGSTIQSLTEILASTDATILEAHGNNPWLFRLRFSDHRGLRDFHNYCNDHDINFRVKRIYTLEEEQDATYSLDLSEEQHEALLAAVEGGYFEVPRRTTLADIGEALGISQQAASERVRRGANQVLQKVLLSKSAADIPAPSRAEYSDAE